MGRRRRRRRRVNFIEMVSITLVVIVLLSFLLVQSSKLRAKNLSYEQEIADLDKEIEEEKERTEEIAELESEIVTDEYAGEIARERLSMVGDDEILFRAEN